MGVARVERTHLRLPTVGTGSESGKTVREVGVPYGLAWPGLGVSRAPPLPSGAHERRPYKVLGCEGVCWLRMFWGLAALHPLPTVGAGSESGKTVREVGVPYGSARPGLGGSRAPPIPSGAHERRPYRVLGCEGVCWLRMFWGLAALHPLPTVGAGSESGKTVREVGVPYGPAWPGLVGSRAAPLPSGAHERRPYRVLGYEAVCWLRMFRV